MKKAAKVATGVAIGVGIGLGIGAAVVAGVALTGLPAALAISMKAAASTGVQMTMVLLFGLNRAANPR